MESDCITLIHAQQHENMARHDEVGLLIEDSRVLAKEVRVKGFLHVKREGNLVAHSLARAAQHGNLEACDWRNFPHEVQLLITGEVLH